MKTWNISIFLEFWKCRRNNGITIYTLIVAPFKQTPHLHIPKKPIQIRWITLQCQLLAYFRFAFQVQTLENYALGEQHF